MRHYLKRFQYKGSYLPCVIFILICILALYIRYKLVPIITPDFTDFLKPWTDHMRAEGIAGLASIESNYNSPYLILIWLASHLPFSDLLNVKLITIFFDFVLAFGVFKVVHHFYAKGIRPYIAAVAVLFAPVVLQNGAAWGQCDAIYASFIVFSLLFSLKGKWSVAWIFWGIALAFKLQAVFFIIPLVALWLHQMKRFTWRSLAQPFYALVTFILMSSLPIVFGKSIADTFGVYLGQTAPIRLDWGLAWFSPTAYNWVANNFFTEIRAAGLIMALFVGLSVVLFAYLYKIKDERNLVAFAAIALLTVLFFVPQLHERYLFSAEILLIITAFVLPRFAWAAVTMQIVSTITYTSYFSQANLPVPIPYPVLSLGVFAIIWVIWKYIYSNSYVRNKLII